VPGLTSRQIQQLLKLISVSSGFSIVSHPEETDEDLDYSFAGMAVRFHAKQECVNWVINTGATDHMIATPEFL